MKKGFCIMLPSPVKSLREQVYSFLRGQMNDGSVKPGEFLNLGDMANSLGISKTPLRDALFQLEAEGFVRIFPRRGVMVRILDLPQIANLYEIIGSLESTAIVNNASKFRTKDIDRMENLNREMFDALEKNDFDSFYQKNLAFHNTYIDLSQNLDLIQMVRIFKQRLYDFPRKKGFVKEWEVDSVGEHRELVDLLKKGDFDGAGKFVRDVHWSYAVQERYIKKYYFASSQELDHSEEESGF